MGLNLESTISLNSASFERGMHRVKDSVADNVKMFVLGAVGVGTIEQAFSKTIETANELVNTSKRLGTTVEQVQLLSQAAKDSGKELETVAAALEKINLARAKALGGDKTSNAAFAALGVSQTDLKTKTAADLFMKNISDTVKKVNPEQIAGPLREVLGRGAGESIAILKTDFDELGKKIGVMSTETAAKLNALSKEFDLVSQIIVTQLAPMLLKLAEWGYKVVMSGGGRLAQAGAEAGDIAAQIADQIKNHDWNKSGEGIKIDWGSAMQAGDDAKAPWQANLKEFEDSLNNAAANLKKQPAPDFNKTQEDAIKMRGERGKIESDSLVKVGNFLGSNAGAVNTSASRMEQHAASTAQSAKQIVTYTKMTADMIGLLYNGKGPRRDFDDRTRNGGASYGSSVDSVPNVN